jgi:His/Glu/Gln/Arg/opine family amino acid ABC transporter permease subunit
VTLAANFDWSLVWQYHSQLLSGLWVAIEVSAVALVTSVLFGLLLALGRMSKGPVKWISALFINVFRGIPALVSVLWVYYGWSLLLNINLSPFQSGVVALTFLYGAFIAEIDRAALLAIPKGQREAGLALGLSRWRIFLHVTLPQATRIAIPNIGSMFIGMVKDTSVFSVVGLTELLRVTQNIESQTYQPFVLYTAAAGFYVAAAFLIDFLFRLIEKILAKPSTGMLSRFATSRQRRRAELIASRSAPIRGSIAASKV